jgi:hypothetical protein
MAYTQTQLDALQAALATGTLTVEFDGKRVTYRSLDEIQRAIEIIKKDLGQATKDRFTFSKHSS